MQSDEMGTTTPEYAEEFRRQRQELIEFLFTYHAPDERQIAAMKEVRAAAMLLAGKLDSLVPPSADRTDAMRKLQECVNTANRGITLGGKGYR